MIIMAGGATKGYQPQISLILSAIAGNLLDFDAFSKASPPDTEGGSKNIIAMSKVQEPWEAFEAHMKATAEPDEVMAFYLPANRGLAHYLAAGLTPDEAIFAWMSTTQGLLSFIKKNRKKVSLIDIDAAVRFPNKFIEYCVNRYRFNGSDDVELLEEIAEPTALHGILSNQIIKQNHDINRLQQELDARSQHISKYTPPDRFNLMEVHENFQWSSKQFKILDAQLQSLVSKDQRNSRKSATLKQKLELLSEHLQDSQALLNEAVEVKNTALEAQSKSEAEVASLSKALELAQRSATNLEKNLKSKDTIDDKNLKQMRIRNDLMSEHLESIQADSEKVYYNYMKVAAELEESMKISRWRETQSEKLVARLEDDLERTHKRINDLENSFSWRITRFVRILSRILGFARKGSSKEDVKRVMESGLFDATWYTKTYPDLVNITMEPVEHFVKYGAFEGRSPGPNFNTRKYTKNHPNVLIDQINPLLHFLNNRE